LTNVELSGACIDATQIAAFVRHTQKLKSFKFSYEVKWHGCGHNWDAGAFVAILEQHLGQTLETLSLSIVTCFGSTGTGVQSMKGFRFLKDLEFDVKLLLGPPYDPGIPDRAETMDVDKGVEGEPSIPAFDGLLPSSIEKLRLLMGGTEQGARCLDALFRGWTLGKSVVNFPRLKELSLSLQTDCEAGLMQYRNIQWVSGMSGGVAEQDDPGSNALFQTTFNERFGVEDW